MTFFLVLFWQGSGFVFAGAWNIFGLFDDIFDVGGSSFVLDGERFFRFFSDVDVLSRTALALIDNAVDGGDVH